MLHVADNVSAFENPASAQLSPETEVETAVTRRSPEEAPVQFGSRYGEQPRFKASALTLTILFHVLVIALLFSIHQQAAVRKKERLVSIDLSPAPPPPPPPTPDTPEPRPPVVTAPQPLLMVNPRPEVIVPVTVDPQPAPPEPVTAPPAPPAPPAPASVIQDGDLGTRMVSGKPPRYPIESRRKKEQGTVVLSLLLGLDGAVEQISVSRSSGFGRLDDAALNAVRKWRWEPITRGGRPVKVRGSVEIPFVLQS